jgi:hypothetical protein
MGNCCTHVSNWMDTMMTDTYLMWKPISFVNMIYKDFVSDGKTDHLRKVCNNMCTTVTHYCLTLNGRTMCIKAHSIDNNTIYVYIYIIY